MSFFFSRRKIDVPASVPPVPTEQMKPSILPLRLLPDFRAGREIVRQTVVAVVPLVGEQHAVLLGLAKLVGEAARDVLVVVGIAVGQGRHFDQFGAAEPQHVLLFLALGVGNDDQRAIAARVGDERQPNAGVAGGALDHEAAGLELAALLGLQDHLAAGAVLHRAAGVHELGLAEDGAAGRGRRPFELDQRRVADGLDDTVADLHGFCACSEVRKRSGRPSGDKAAPRLRKIMLRGAAAEVARVRRLSECLSRRGHR